MPCDPKAGRKENVMETGNADVGKMEAELRQWGARLDDLLATADRAGTARRIDYRERLDDAKQKYDAAEAKLAELNAVNGRSSEAASKAPGASSQRLSRG
jgi:hypothetical protein